MYAVAGVPFFIVNSSTVLVQILGPGMRTSPSSAKDEIRGGPCARDRLRECSSIPEDPDRGSEARCSITHLTRQAGEFQNSPAGLPPVISGPILDLRFLRRLVSSHHIVSFYTTNDIPRSARGSISVNL